MSLSFQKLRPVLPLVIGLVVGGFGVSLFRSSLPGPEGSAQEQADRLADQLKQAQRQIFLLESGSRRRDGAPLTDGLRTLAGDLNNGKPVSPEDVLRRIQPLLRELAPLLARLREQQYQGILGGKVVEYSQKYGLDEAQQKQLAAWMKQRGAEDAKSWSRLIGSDSVSLAELEKQTRSSPPNRGIEEFMATQLDGENLAKFQDDLKAQKSWEVKRDANGKTEQINRAVQLDDDQRRKVFGIMARSSDSYDPSVDVPGANEGSGTGMEAALKVLRPEQRSAYEQGRERRRTDAAVKLGALGLSLPDDWESFR